MTAWARALVLAGLLALTGACGGGDEEPTGPDPAELEGAWDVSLVVGLVDAGPEADRSFPSDATYRERWVFEGCDEDGCTLRRPDGGFLLGDLDDVRVALGPGRGLDTDSDLRLVGEGTAAFPPPVEEDDATPCDGGPTQRWSVRIEVGVAGGVLSGSAFRRPEALRVDLPDATCFGHDLTLGLSGTPDR